MGARQIKKLCEAWQALPGKLLNFFEYYSFFLATRQSAHWEYPLSIAGKVEQNANFLPRHLLRH